MAYRRRQPISRASTFKEDVCSTSSDFNPQISRVSTFKDDYRSHRDDDSPSPSSSSSLPFSKSFLGQAIRASSARRGSPLSAYRETSYREPNRPSSASLQQDSKPYEYTSLGSPTPSEPKYGFWGVLAKKAKSILEDDNIPKLLETTDRTNPEIDMSTGEKFHQSCQSPGSFRKAGSPRLQRGLDAVTSSLDYIGDTIGNKLEVGRTVVENKTADISETRKLLIRRKGSGPRALNHDTNGSSPQQPPQNQADQETQLKASRDVAMAMTAKAKLLLRELKTMKADLAFAKERCAQLEEENKVLRECHEKGVGPEDDELIRLQLETLLTEKSRLANENSIFARENMFLREVVEYHQLTMQDVVYLDESIEEVAEVYPIPSTEIILDACLPIPPCPPDSAQNLTDSSPPILTTPTSPTARTDVASPDIQVLAGEDPNNRQHSTSPSST